MINFLMLLYTALSILAGVLEDRVSGLREGVLHSEYVFISTVMLYS